eukprot:GHVS01051603.1.p1 GENE.GHVS01051603.1~~GHVS01051603.1.p1  ORF type:complete len:396 (-),score=84.99 GHVS01051603.1:256-1443(-)
MLQSLIKAVARLSVLCRAAQHGEPASPSSHHPEEPIPEELKFGRVPLEGKKKALLIGINYRGQTGELKGCINDVCSVRRFLLTQGFEQGNISVLIDAQADGDADGAGGLQWNEEEEGKVDGQPTRDGILSGFDWLTEEAASGDSLFLHYSGHGTRVKDVSGDEKDGYDEALVPMDHGSVGLLLDDDIYKHLVKPLPVGCRLTILLDCCHSGSGCDLPYAFQATDEHMNIDFAQRVPEVVMNQHWDFKNFQSLLKTGQTVGMQLWQDYKNSSSSSGGPSGFRLEVPGQEGDEKNGPDVVMLSGCNDLQTSADVHDVASFSLPADSGPGGAGGACTSAMLVVLAGRAAGEAAAATPPTYVELLDGMRQELKKRGFQQIPQLSCTKRIPLDRYFSLNE